ncbi:MAG: NUMOD3 domain-containing DNA-binding protein [Nitrososphaeraceae archaeon]
MHYITGKREHTEETRKKMSEAAKRRWMKHQYTVDLHLQLLILLPQ